MGLRKWGTAFETSNPLQNSRQIREKLVDKSNSL